MAFSYLTDKIQSVFEGLYTGMIQIDLQKAFATIEHNIFLEKPKCIGFSEKTHGIDHTSIDILR